MRNEERINSEGEERGRLAEEMASPGCVREPHLERPAWVFAAGPVVGNEGPHLSQSVVQAASKRGVIFVPLAARPQPSEDQA